jgi:NAD-dependent deacetylase
VSVDALAEALRASRYTVVLTGAGLSTESGIPDFRSAGGIWAKTDPMEVGSLAGFRDDPERFYGFWSGFFAGLGTVVPSAMHQLLAGLETRGLVHAVITQNVDGLHQLAGSQRVLEAHGNWQRTRCTGCGRRDRWDVVMARAAGGLPRCAACGALVRPDVVLFGEALGPAFGEAEHEARRAELFVAMGTSLEVAPVSGLPQLAREEGGLGRGATVAIVNRDPTAEDGAAHLLVRGELGRIAEALGALLS